MRCGAAAGLLAAVVAGLAGCGDSDGGAGTGAEATASVTTSAPSNPDAGTVEPTSPGPAASDVELIEIEISDGEIIPPLGRVSVDRGGTVRIVVTSDESDEVHLHGYDLEAAVGTGEPGVIEFVADQTGLFELETHHAGLVLLQLLVE